MDSSRNGLLSTLLMTLPLIAVPAMALLRPPGQQPGVSTSPLEAKEESPEDWLDDGLGSDSEPDEETPLFEDEEKPKSKPDRSKKKHAEPEFDGLFDVDPGENKKGKKPVGTKSGGKKANPESKSEASSGRSEAMRDPFIDGEIEESKPEDSGRTKKTDDESMGSDFKEVPDSDEVDPLPSGPRADEVVKQLTARGAVRTKWFEAGERYPVGLAVYFRGRNDDEQIRFESVGQTRDDCAADVLKQVDEWKSETGSP